MKKIGILFLIMISIGFSVISFGQTETELEELKAMKAEKEAAAAELEGQLSALKGEIAGLKSKIDKTIRWHKGAGGIIGVDINNFNNWAPKADLNSSAQTISFAYNGFVNLIDDKYFWRNNGAINLGWLRFDQDTKTDEQGEDNKFQQVADVFNAQSLFGYNVSKNLAASALGEYRTSVLSNFNNPGYLDLGVGFTYTPISNLVIVFHPLNYNLIFAQDDTQYTSSIGAKFVANYATEIYKGVNWRSNLSGFLSYSGSDLSNYTWINGINFTAFKGIGVGIELGLRWNPQETAARELSSSNQSYYAIGLSYSL